MNHTMKSLTNMCYKNIIDNILQMPPYLQEILIGKSLKSIKKKIKRKLKISQFVDAKDILPLIVPEIMEDIISSMTENNRCRSNYVEKYTTIDPVIIDMAVKISENSVLKMEERYISAAFYIKNTRDYTDEYFENHSEYD